MRQIQLKTPEYYESLYEELNQRFGIPAPAKCLSEGTLKIDDVKLAPPPEESDQKASIRSNIEASKRIRPAEHHQSGVSQASISAKTRHAARREEVKRSDCPGAEGRKHHFKKIGFDRYGQQKFKCTACKVGYTESKH